MLWYTAANAQLSDSCSFTMRGKIIDQHDGTPLEFATIYLVEENRGAVSNEKGEYVLKNMCNGSHTIRITHLGCNPLEVKVKVKENLEKNFFPEHHS